MAIPIQYIPEDRAAIAQAQIQADLAKASASMWQSAQENALKAQLTDKSLAQDERLKLALANKEEALRQQMLNQELGAKAVESAADRAERRRSEMEKFRLTQLMQQQDPQTQLAREQLSTYKALTPEERVNKVLGRNPEEEKRAAERFAFEKQKFGEQVSQAEQDRAFTRSKWFSDEEAKKTFSVEDANKAWLKFSGEIAKNPLFSNAETQLKLYSDVVAAAPGVESYERYLNTTKEYFLKPDTRFPEEAIKRQGQALTNLLSMKKNQLARAEVEAEKYVSSPEVYSMKKLAIEQDKANLTRLEHDTAVFLKELYGRKETSWWSKAGEFWGRAQKHAQESALVPGGGLVDLFLGRGEK